MIVSLLEDGFVTVVLTDLSLTFLLLILTEPPPHPPRPLYSNLEWTSWTSGTPD